MTFTPGQLVRFRTPDPGEEHDTFTVIEDRDTRILVASTDPVFATWRVPPTFVYATSDLEAVPS